MRRFKLTVDAAGRGALIDQATGLAIKGVRAVTIVSRIDEATRVIVEYIGDGAEAEIETEKLEGGA